MHPPILNTHEMHAILIDDELFGNEAGEDEDLEILNSYFVEKENFGKFYSHKGKFRIARSKKGVGKSTLLKKTMAKMESAPSRDSICLYIKGSDLVATGSMDSSSPNDLINSWQQRLSIVVNREIGRRIKFATSDIDISLVEASELSNFKSRNFVSSLLDRISYKDELPKLEKKFPKNELNILRSKAEKDEISVWLFVDDVDATFVNQPDSRLETSTFFTACRTLVNNVKGLNIRCSVRTDVWEVLATHDEALDKCNQYLLDLKWTTSESCEILCRKILSYFRRRYPKITYYKQLQYPEHHRAILDLIFTKSFRWNGAEVPPDRPIFILSGGRPRWAAHLCKLAAKRTNEEKRNRINISHIDKSLKEYGEFRLRDLYKEHAHQCAILRDLIEIFSAGPKRYTTDSILTLITAKIIRKHGAIKIEGAYCNNGGLGIAHFLYRIGFIHGRDQDGIGLNFVRFEDRPDLLTTTENLDDGLVWEIHPSYRNVLRIRAPRNSGPNRPSDGNSRRRRR